MRTVVVAGHGMVGHRLVEALVGRDTQRQWRIVVLAEEGRPAYDRVALSSYVDSWDVDKLTLPVIADDRVEDPRQVLKPGQAQLITQLLQNVVRYGTGKRAAIPGRCQTGSMAILVTEISPDACRMPPSALSRRRPMAARISGMLSRALVTAMLGRMSRPLAISSA